MAKLPLPKGKRMPVAGPVTTVHRDEEDLATAEPDFGLDDPATAAADWKPQRTTA